MAKKYSYPVFYQGMRRRDLAAAAKKLKLDGNPSSDALLAALRADFRKQCAKKMGVSEDELRGML